MDKGLSEYIDFTKNYVRFRQRSPSKFKTPERILEMRWKNYRERLEEKARDPSIRKLPKPRLRKGKFYTLDWNRVKDREGFITPKIKKLLGGKTKGHKFLVGFSEEENRDMIQSVLEPRKIFESLESSRPELQNLYRFYHFWKALYTWDFSDFDEDGSIEDSFEEEYKIKISELLNKSLGRDGLSKEFERILYEADLVSKMNEADRKILEGDGEGEKGLLTPEALYVYSELRKNALDEIKKFYSEEL